MQIPYILLLADPYALLCSLILIMIILMRILIESRSMLMVYWFGDRKLINGYLTENRIQNINLQKSKMIYCKKYMCINVFNYFCLNILYTW